MAARSPRSRRPPVFTLRLLPCSPHLVSSCSLAVAVGVGVWWRGDLDLGVGELVAFLFLVNLILNPIAQLGEVLDQTQTAVLLIGLDGGVKAQYKAWVEPQVIFDQIDRMPMRRAELRRRQE